MTEKSQNRFTKVKLCSIVLYHATTQSIKNGGILNSIYHNFSKSFVMVSRNTFVDSLVRHTSEKCHRLCGELARLLSSKLLLANGSRSNLEVAMYGVPQGWTLSLKLFNIYINNWREMLEYTYTRLADAARLGREVEHEKEKLPY